MIKQDKEVLWRPGRVWYGAQDITGMIGAAGVSAGVHTGAPVQQEIGTTGHVGILLDTAGDMVTHNAPIPDDLDPRHPVYARVVWCSGSTDTADTVTWIVLYKTFIPNVSALATADVALNKTIAAMDVPVATALAVCKTGWGKINGGTISDKAEDWSWLVEMDAFDAGLAEDKFFLGLEIMYTPRRLQGQDGMQMPAQVPAYALAKNVNG